ncbi:MAG: transglutaminase domain-containing protein, partial [Prevotella sp.]|nr:transglutaminase domain-containing protein [Prevotella sp.]
MKRILLFAFAILAGSPLLLAQEQRHFMTDAAYRQKVEKVFNEKMKQVGKQFFDTKNQTVSLEEKEALTFLYAYMATADVTDYTTSFYLKNVRSSFATREQMAWGRNVPELLFRHFVLPVRVNNENLDSSRWVFYNELKDRVRGLSMKEAILEVNHWCHEKVTYQPSDARTSSPLASIRSAYGRCGEESTFTVAALRSVGIPARQVYTPRWAHTDDNHAWVEAWADGEWYFLGACEPEAVLNLGWFNAPASRAMLMHTRAFGDYNGPEEVVLRTNNFTEINLIDNYAKTARIDFRVADGNGNPVEGAKVEFKIYNYAEFYTAVTKYTDSEGRTFL